mmetsp:Transcript_149122/g.211924  ORF Transcript_149122/g.211924 Transcript_149122/m.211924 type:complete len:600 (+) Transcript_149122:24-1823(+)
MSYEQKTVYLCNPATERGKKIMMHGDPKGKNFLYCRGKYIVVRDIANPLEGFLYSEHPCKTTCAKYAPSGNYVASCDEKGTCRIWDTLGEDKMLKYEYNALRGAISDVCWTEDSKRIAVCGVGAEDVARAFLWDSGSSVGQLTGHAKQVNSLDIKQQRPYRLVTAGEDCEVGFYANVPFKRQAMLTDHKKYVNCARYSPNGELFVTADAGGKAFVYDGKEGTVKGELNGGEASAHKGGIYGISWLDDSRQLLTCSADKTCRLWDVVDNKLITTFSFPQTLENMQVGCLAQGEHLISVSLNGYINYLDKANPDTPLRVIRGHSQNVTALGVSEDAGMMYTGSTEGRICAWKIGSPEPTVLENTHKSEVVAMEVVDGAAYSIGIDDMFFKTPVGEEKFGAGVKLPSSPSALAVGKGVAVVACLKHVAVVRDDKKVFELEIDYEASGISISAAGTVAVGGNDKKVHLYTLDGDALTESGTYDVLEPVTCVSYSPDGAYLAVGDAKRQVYGFETASGSMKFDRWKYHSAKITSLAWTPDSQHLASGSLDTNIYIWSVAKPMSKIKMVAAHPSGMVTAVKWVSDNVLFSSGYDGCVRTWEVKHV